MTIKDWIQKEARDIRSVLFTKTIAGAALDALGYLADPSVTGMLPPKYQWVSTSARVLGGLLAAVGVRHALLKMGALPGGSTAVAGPPS